MYLPLAGQLVYPSAHILLPSSTPRHSPICVVAALDVLTPRGWTQLANLTKLSQQQQPLQLYREGEEVYLQWLGGPEVHRLLEGRLLLVSLVCKDTEQSPCIAFRTAGSPGREPDNVEEQSQESGLTERDYLAIGVCAGFLIVLYVFAMIVFIMIKMKARQEKQLREEFLQLPAPPGLGYKCSRILGLEDSYMMDMARRQGEGRHSVRSRHSDLHTEVQPGRLVGLSREQLEVHRREVESRLQEEVACSLGEGERCCREGGCDGDVLAKLGGGGRRRFLPHLEEIPEESRCSTVRREMRADDSDGGEQSPEIRYKESSNSFDEPSSHEGTGRSSSHQTSLDSGIVTRSASPSPEQGSHTSELSSSSQGIYSDLETVDVAGSDTDETDSERDIGHAGEVVEAGLARRCSTEPGRGKVKSNLDFLSDIYHTAFSKLPKVQSAREGSEENTCHSPQDSLEPRRGRNMYRNPAFDEGPRTSKVSSVSGVYILGVGNAREPSQELLPGELRRSVKFSAGEKMMISITGNCEDPVFSDKLMNPVRGTVRKEESEQEEFDPDTLERDGNGLRTQELPHPNGKLVLLINYEIINHIISSDPPVFSKASLQAPSADYTFRLYSSEISNQEGKKGRALFE